jgi:hypothetical protein
LFHLDGSRNLHYKDQLDKAAGCWKLHVSMDKHFPYIFFLNNQPDALIFPILLCYKILYVSGIFSAHHQEFSTVHSALVSLMQIYDDRFQAQSGWNILTLLVSGHQKPA